MPKYRKLGGGRGMVSLGCRGGAENLAQERVSGPVQGWVQGAWNGPEVVQRWGQGNTLHTASSTAFPNIWRRPEHSVLPAQNFKAPIPILGPTSAAQRQDPPPPSLLKYGSSSGTTAPTHCQLQSCGTGRGRQRNHHVHTVRKHQWPGWTRYTKS